MSPQHDDLLTLPSAGSLVTALQEQFRSSPYLALRQLTCDRDIDHNRVVVRGALPSYYLKQVAQAVAVKTVGVGVMASEISVESSELIHSEYE